MVEGIEKGRARVSPSGLFGLSKVLMGVAPPVRTVYWKLETAKLERFKKKLRTMVREDVAAVVEKGREVGEALLEKEREARKDLEEKAAHLREELEEKIHGA